MKKPSLKIYQKYARIYLDEYEGQKELREEYFEKTRFTYKKLKEEFEKALYNFYKTINKKT